MGARRTVLIAPAKVNLYLAVTGVLPDGYHELSTVFQALELHDTVTLEPADALSVTCAPDPGTRAEHNTAWRAAEALADVAGRSPVVAVRIDKRIPHGGGLGGGSADAAAVLWGLARWWDLDPSGDLVMDAAAAVGADVAFFLVGGAALFDRRGDRLVGTLPSGRFDVALVNPGLEVSTPEVYRVFDAGAEPRARGPRDMADALRAGDAATVAGALHNSLAEAAYSIEPVTAECVGWLSERPGVLGSLLAGSGATAFAVCEDAAAADSVAAAAVDEGWWACATRASGHGVREVPAGEGDR